MRRETNIIADGRRRAQDGGARQVRAELAAKYAEELKAAGWWKRMRLRRILKTEFRKKMKELAPLDGLY